jgi:hypothetical protein
MNLFCKSFGWIINFRHATLAAENVLVPVGSLLLVIAMGEEFC